MKLKKRLKESRKARSTLSAGTAGDRGVEGTSQSNRQQQVSLSEHDDQPEANQRRYGQSRDPAHGYEKGEMTATVSGRWPYDS